MVMHKSWVNQGIMMPLVLILTLVLLMISTALLIWMRVETKDTLQKRKATRDVYYAEIGTEKALHRLTTDLSWGSTTVPLGMFTNNISGETTYFELIVDGLRIGVTVQDIP